MQCITRAFEIDMGHRVMGHENLCRNAHGHRYRIEATISAAALDSLGRVLDYSVVKDVLGGHLLRHYDHAFACCEADTEMRAALACIPDQRIALMRDNPTAENLAVLWLRQFGQLLERVGEQYQVIGVRVYETPNCWADAIAHA